MNAPKECRPICDAQTAEERCSDCPHREASAQHTPELLDIVRRFEATMRAPASPSRVRALEALADRARAAIAKATGSAS